jgi:hypothetical protein
MEGLLPRQDRNELNSFPSGQDHAAHVPIQLPREWFRQTRNRLKCGKLPDAKNVLRLDYPVEPEPDWERESNHVLED